MFECLRSGLWACEVIREFVKLFADVRTCSWMFRGVRRCSYMFVGLPRVFPLHIPSTCIIAKRVCIA
jgi:hypothetical protein